jgi:hypothetical protein
MQAHAQAQALPFDHSEGGWFHWWRPFQARILRTAKFEQTPQEASNGRPGWFWRTAEGRQVMRALEAVRSNPDSVYSSEMGWQNEAD